MKLITYTRLFFKRALTRRFESAELLLALSLVFHGIWLTFPYWSSGGSPTEAPRSLELVFAVTMLFLGAVHTPMVLADWRSRTPYLIRRGLAMSSFMGHAFLLFLLALTLGFSSVFIIPYVILTLLGALAYLSMSVMRDE